MALERMKKMNEIIGKEVTVNGVDVKAYSRKLVTEESKLTILAGTTGICGGDREAGSRTIITIENTGASDFFADVERDETGGTKSVVIAACGDNELRNFIKGLLFVLDVLTETALGDD